MVAATKKKSAPKTKQPTKAEKEAKRFKELSEYSDRLRQAQTDINEAELAMVRAKSASKEAGAHYQSCIGAMRRLVDEYENPQKNLPLFHHNASNGTSKPKAKESKAAEPADKPKLNISTEPWRSLLLSKMPGVPKGAVKHLTAAGLETLGQMVDWQNANHCGVERVDGIGPTTAEKISDAMEAYWKANPAPAEVEVEKASEPELAGAAS